MSELMSYASTMKPLPLPWCDYPTARDLPQHGVQLLPQQLLPSDLVAVRAYRSNQFQAVPAASLSDAQILQMARVVASSFARREPMMSHVVPPVGPPAGLDAAIHTDPFGSDAFGPWTRENILYWFVRLFLLTDPTSPTGAIERNEDTLSQSLALIGENGKILGGAFNETMPPIDVEPAFRQDDLFLAAVWPYLEPAIGLLTVQDEEAISALSNQFPDFKAAYAHEKVGHHFMIARSDELSKEDTFELIAGSVERYQALGYEYMLIEASNQWTGAACELLGGVRVHHAPYKAEKCVLQSAEPVADVASSPDGYISYKDSGCMFYVIRVV